MGTKSLDGNLFRELMKGGAANLAANSRIVNDLNVFPIPDGDTGENMSQTVAGGMTAASECTDSSISAMSQAMAQGMIFSARGNSGVILSQFFAGIAKGFQDQTSADVATLGLAFRSGVRRAYDAVIKPTEGTMLTVAREAAEYACDRITPESTLESFFSDYLQEMNASLQRTPELLAVLKEAGVIDSGGAGLVYIIDGMNRVLHGETLQTQSIRPAAPTADYSAFNENSVLEFGYCTEFLLQLQTCKGSPADFSLERFKKSLSDMGDSIVAFQTGTVIKVHIHTRHPGAVLDCAQQYGEFLTMKIENMTLQHNESVVRNDFPAPEHRQEKPRSRFATVTVAAGSGVQQALRSLGADVVLDGGQGKNPSAERFLQAFEEANADDIFVLPNNCNIILAAKQAAGLYKGGAVHVVESADLGAGYAALSMRSYDSGDPAEIEASMRAAMQGVQTGLITSAARDASVSGVSIRKGDYIGFSGRQMLAAAADRIETAQQLLQRLNADQHEVLIVIYDDSVVPEEKMALRRYVQKNYRRLELYTLDGGQDGYDLQLILE
jgi:DAK2 domain fusion protein YloV